MEPATKNDLKDLMKELLKELKEDIKVSVAAAFGNRKPALEQATTPAASQLLSTDAPASPTTIVDVVPVLAASSASAKPLDIDAMGVVPPTPTTCSTECPSRDATASTYVFTLGTTTIDVTPVLAASVVTNDFTTPSRLLQAAAQALIHELKVLRPAPWPSFKCHWRAPHTMKSLSWLSCMWRIGPGQEYSCPQSEIKALVSNMSMVYGNRSSSHGYIIGNVLLSPSGIWCLGELFLGLMSCWSDIQYVQQTNSVLEGSLCHGRHIIQIFWHGVAVAPSFLLADFPEEKSNGKPKYSVTITSYESRYKLLNKSLLIWHNFPPSPDRTLMPWSLDSPSESSSSGHAQSLAGVVTSCSISGVHHNIGHTEQLEAYQGLCGLSSQPLVVPSSGVSDAAESLEDPLITNGRIPEYLFKSLPTWDFRSGLEEAQKFLPGSDKLVIDLEAADVSKPQEAVKDIPLNVSKTEVLKAKKNRASEDLDLIEGRNIKQSAFCSDEPDDGVEMFDDLFRQTEKRADSCTTLRIAKQLINAATTNQLQKNNIKLQSLSCWNWGSFPLLILAHLGGFCGLQGDYCITVSFATNLQLEPATATHFLSIPGHDHCLIQNCPAVLVTIGQATEGEQFNCGITFQESLWREFVAGDTTMLFSVTAARCMSLLQQPPDYKEPSPSSKCFICELCYSGTFSSIPRAEGNHYQRVLCNGGEVAYLLRTLNGGVKQFSKEYLVRSIRILGNWGLISSVWHFQWLDGFINCTKILRIILFEPKLIDWLIYYIAGTIFMSKLTRLNIGGDASFIFAYAVVNFCCFLDIADHKSIFVTFFALPWCSGHQATDSRKCLDSTALIAVVMVFARTSSVATALQFCAMINSRIAAIHCGIEQFELQQTVHGGGSILIEDVLQRNLTVHILHIGSYSVANHLELAVFYSVLLRCAAYHALYTAVAVPYMNDKQQVTLQSYQVCAITFLHLHRMAPGEVRAMCLLDDKFLEDSSMCVNCEDQGWCFLSSLLSDLLRYGIIIIRLQKYWDPGGLGLQLSERVFLIRLVMPWNLGAVNSVGAIEFPSRCEQAPFQGGRSIMVLAFVNHHYYLDASFDLGQVYFDKGYHHDYTNTEEHQVPWDPGGNTLASAWGQAEFQGGRIVSNLAVAAIGWAWAMGNGLGPTHSSTYS